MAQTAPQLPGDVVAGPVASHVCDPDSVWGKRWVRQSWRDRYQRSRGARMMACPTSRSLHRPLCRARLSIGKETTSIQLLLMYPRR